MKKSEKESKAEVWRLFKHHTHIPSSFEKWAIRHSFATARAYKAYAEGKFWCSYCGGSFEAEPSSKEQEIICPHCGKKIVVPAWENGDWGRGTTRKCSYDYAQRNTIIKGWQVIQQFTVVMTSIRGKQATYSVVLLYEHWLNPNTQKAYIIGRYLKMMCSWYEMPFGLGSEFSFKRLSYWYEDWESAIYAKNKLLPIFSLLKPDNIRQIYDIKVSNEEIYHAAALSPVIAETIYKIGDNSLGELYFGSAIYRSRIIRYWKSILIARRHGYLQKLSGILALRDWLDYIEDLRYLKRDVRNPHFICPADLQASHSSVSASAHKKRERAERRAENARLIKEERRRLEEIERDKRAKAEFSKKIKPYAALVFIGNNLRISPLLTIQDFMEEGAAMCHCVFSNKYYARPDTLILSARDNNDERVETIEVDTKKYVIVQSRAKRNGTSSMHDDIINLVNSNMERIKQCTNRRKIA